MAKKLFGTVLLLGMAARAFALGSADFSSEIISARSLGQGGVGVAGVSDDAVSAYTNPAALTAVPGTQIMAELGYANGQPSCKSDLGGVAGGKHASVLVPGFAASTLLMGGRLAAGVSAVTPYGLETHFNGDGPLRYKATDSRLRIVVVSPAAAYKVNDQLSVGAGFDYANTLEGQLDKKALFPGATADASSRLNGNGDGWGYHAGLTYRPNEHHSIGLVYHSTIKISLTGDVELSGLNGGFATTTFGGTSFKTDVTAPVYLPQNVQLGYAFLPDPEWAFEVDAAWYDWYSSRQLGIVYSGLTATQATVLGNNNPELFRPRKAVSFGLGANYKANEQLQLRGGAYYQAASQAETGFAVAFVDLPRYAATAGAGYALTKNLGVDLAYNATFFHARHITGSPNAVDGSYSNFVSIFSAALTCRLPSLGG